MDVIEDLRNEDDEDLIIQCNVFDDEKQEDDEDLEALNPAGVDISNPQEVFNALYQKVFLIVVALATHSTMCVMHARKKFVYFFIKAFVVGSHLNCIDLSM